jgi:hypothetical protein
MEKRTQVKVAMTYGGMYGLASAAIYFIFYFAGADMQAKSPQFISYILLIMFLVMGMKSYRDQELGGYITYGRSLGTGILIGMFGGIITGFCTVLMFTMIDPGLAEKIVEKAQEQMIEKGTMSEDQIEMAMGWTRKMMSPIFLFIFSILGSAFMSFLFSLIISIFTRKEASPFQS